MVKRVFWFAVGAGVGVFALYKVRSYIQTHATPQAIGQRASDTVGDLTDTAREFAERVRAGMVEREAELRDALGLPEQTD